MSTLSGRAGTQTRVCLRRPSECPFGLASLGATLAGRQQGSLAASTHCQPPILDHDGVPARHGCLSVRLEHGFYTKGLNLARTWAIRHCSLLSDREEVSRRLIMQVVGALLQMQISF